MDRENRQIYTVDINTIASHPGRLSVSTVRWALRFPKWPAMLASFVLFPLILLFIYGTNTLYFVLIMIFLTLSVTANKFYWKRVHEHFRYGDTNPAIVVSEEPFLIATRTDLSKGHGRYPVIKIVREPRSGFSGRMQVGRRVATVALYRGDPNDDRPHWEDFFPYAVEPVAADREEAKSLLESFDAGEWQALEDGLHEVKAMREGLHKIEVDSSDWKYLG